MAVTVNAAVYGQGVYGVARYGAVIVSNLDQVQATASVSQVEVGSSQQIGSVSASISVSTPSVISSSSVTGVAATANISNIQISPEKLLDSLAATGDVSGVSASSSAGPTGVGGSISTGQLQVEIASILSSVSATIDVDTLVAFVELPLPSLLLSAQTGLLVATGNVFSYNAVANLYSRARTILLPRG